MQDGERSRRTADSLLAYHINVGHLFRIRRGILSTVPSGADPKIAPIDPYLVAAKMAPDAVLGYHTALEFHGKAHSVNNRFNILTSSTIRKTLFRGQAFIGMHHPKPLRDAGMESTGVILGERMGVPIQVTSFERTLVDVLDKPELSGGWEETWRSIESIEYFDIDKVIKYVLLLGKATTISKVGFFLDSNRERLFVTNDILEKLRAHCPKEPHYLERDTSKGKSHLVSGWNIIIPERLLEKSWEEPL